jgi:hypothetical protein
MNTVHCQVEDEEQVQKDQHANRDVNVQSLRQLLDVHGHKVHVDGDDQNGQATRYALHHPEKDFFIVYFCIVTLTGAHSLLKKK